MHREVGVALPVADLRIDQPAVHHHRAVVAPLALAARQRPQRLGEQLDAGTRTLTSPVRVRNSRPSTPTWSSRSSSCDQAPGIAERVTPEVELDPAGRVLEVGEDRLSLAAQRHESAGEAHHRPVVAQGIVPLGASASAARWVRSNR